MVGFKLKMVATATVIVTATAACTVHEQETPSLSGPSELGKSIALTVDPDVLAQDGASQSLVSISARDANGQPLRSLSLRADVAVNGSVTTTLGSLSARSLVTDNGGNARVVYTAPTLPAGIPIAAGTIQILVTPAEGDFGNSTSRSVSIRLVVPPSVVVPPTTGVVAKFTANPSAPTETQVVLFDGSTSTSDRSSIVNYFWNFGDGATSSGVTAQHSYGFAGTYVVSLTVTDAVGGTNSAAQTINVGQGQAPTATFTTSPTTPLPAQQVFFNATASRPAPGHTIVSYAWDFGDGSSGSGAQTSHVYAANGGYNVTLSVTDDAGHIGTLTQSVTIGDDTPQPDFTFSPSTPAAGTFVNFNGSASKAAPGRTIVSYTWSWGDGSAPGSGVNASHAFGVAGSYTVTLTVVDDKGKSGTITHSVPVS